MTVPQRLLAVPALAGVLYLSLIVAGLSGFDSSIWALYTALFLIWHVLMHMQGPALAVVVLVHGALAAALLGLGALIGQWVGFAPSPYGALAVGATATVLARIVRLPPEKALEIAALADEAQARMAAQFPEPEPQAAPEPELSPDPPDTEAAILADLFARLNTFSADAPRHHDLVDAITAATGRVPLPDLVSALFERARASLRTRDLQAVTVLLTDPHVAARVVGNGDLEAAFHLVVASRDPAALAHWAMQTEAVLDLVPEALADLPDAQALLDAAEASPAADMLRALAARRADSDESPAP